MANLPKFIKTIVMLKPFILNAQPPVIRGLSRRGSGLDFALYTILSTYYIHFDQILQSIKDFGLVSFFCRFGLYIKSTQQGPSCAVPLPIAGTALNCA